MNDVDCGCPSGPYTSSSINAPPRPWATPPTICPSALRGLTIVPAGVGAHAVGQPAGVTENDFDRLVRDLQLVGGDLGQHRRRALPLRRRAGVDGDLAGGIDPNAAALERSGAGHLVVDADAQAD